MRTSSGRSRLPPAASVSDAPGPQVRAAARARLLQQALDPLHQRGHLRAAEQDDLVDRAHAPTVPEWIAMIPPASIR